MERPDYDAIEQRLKDWEPYLGRDEHWSSGSITLLLSDQEKLLERCRELEAENRRMAAGLEQIKIENRRPLRRELEVGFRHSRLTVKEQIERYQENCYFAWLMAAKALDPDWQPDIDMHGEPVPSEAASKEAQEA